MKVTITAAFGRVQVELPAAAAERLMLDAVRTAAYLDNFPVWGEMQTACAEEPGEQKNDTSEPDPELSRYLTQENCGGPEGPGEAKQAEPAEDDDAPGNESGG